MPVVSRQEMWQWGHKAVLSFPSGQAGAEFIAAEKKGHNAVIQTQHWMWFLQETLQFWTAH